jgi:hypothetical protein
MGHAHIVGGKQGLQGILHAGEADEELIDEIESSLSSSAS